MINGESGIWLNLSCLSLNVEKNDKKTEHPILSGGLIFNHSLRTKKAKMYVKKKFYEEMCVNFDPCLRTFWTMEKLATQMVRW